MLKKLKSLILDDTVYIAFLLVFTAIGSFGLGKMTNATPQKTAGMPESAVTMTLSGSPNLSGSTTAVVLKPVPTKATFTSQPVVLVEQQEVVLVRNFVASKAGTKYHALTCAGAKTIKETNKIFFTSVEEAEAAGYTRAANCPAK